MKMEEEIAKIKLGRNEDPETIVDKLTVIQVQYGAILSDEKRAVVVIKVGRVNYASTITPLCRLMQKMEGRDPTMAKLIQDRQRKEEQQRQRSERDGAGQRRRRQANVKQEKVLQLQSTVASRQRLPIAKQERQRRRK